MFNTHFPETLFDLKFLLLANSTQNILIYIYPSHFMQFSKKVTGVLLRKYHFSILKKRILNGWSKSIVLENKVAINFDFRSGAKKSGHLDYPLQSYGPKQVRLICTHPWFLADISETVPLR